MNADISWVGGRAIDQRLERMRRSVYAFREESSWAVRCALVLSFAAFTGLCAQVSFPLPFTPVPVTGQVFAVLAASSVLGRWLGPASQAAYLALGAVGVPWFAPTAGAGPFTSGGWPALLGATGGYLLGFLVASAVIGRMLDRGLSERSFGANLLVLLGGVGLIYTIGTTQLAVLLDLPPATAVLYGAVPFLPGDILKAVLAAGLLGFALPRYRTEPATPASVRPRLRRADVVGVIAVLGAVWIVAGLVVAFAAAPPALASYYLLAATVCTAATFLALGVRRALDRRSWPVPGVARS